MKQREKVILRRCPEYNPEAIARPEFMDGLLVALKDKAAAEMRITAADGCSSRPAS